MRRGADRLQHVHGPCSHPGGSPRTFAAVVTDYIRRYRRDVEKDLRRYRNVSLRRAIELAARSEEADGKLAYHQRRLGARLLAEAAEDLLSHDAEIRDCRDFRSLHDLVQATIGRWKGIGALAIYDVALRIGANLGLEPGVVYLHAGTKEGALVLGFRGKTVSLAELPSAFRRLRPREIEDVLCIYRDDLMRIVRAQHMKA